MSLLIHGLKLPKLYNSLTITITPYGNVYGRDTGEPLSTTAIEVPPHGDLIDRDALIIPYDICDGDEAMEFINEAPTIIPAEPAEEGT